MDVALPRLADTLTEGTLARWLRRAGDQVAEGEAIAELETDKINSELAAPVGGVLTEVLVGEGETVEVGTVLARIAPAGEAPREREPDPAATPTRTVPAAPGGRSERLREHLRASRERVPAGMCAREIPEGASLERLPEVAARAARGRRNLSIGTLPPAAASHLVVPALPPGRAAMVQSGAGLDGHRLLTLCFDRRLLDDWQADRLLAEIAEGLAPDRPR